MTETGVRASGIGSWPDVGSRDAVRAVRDLLVGDAPEGLGIPYVPEMPMRGPGADMIGRAAAFLDGLSVDLQPSGWRLVDAPGRDVRRADSYLGQDLDEVAEAYEGYAGPLKTQVTGPWTLAAGLWLPRGERVVSDTGATRDLAQSLMAGVLAHVEHLRDLVPGCGVIVQLDEPSLPAVLAGRVRSASGLRRVPAPDRGAVADLLAGVVEALHADGVQVVLHSCAPEVPLDLFRQAGADAVAIDMSLLREASYDDLGSCIDAGVALWAGIAPTTALGPAHAPGGQHPRTVLDPFLGTWRRIGYSVVDLAAVVLTPACGLGHSPAADAVRVQRQVVEAAAMVREMA